MCVDWPLVQNRTSVMRKKKRVQWFKGNEMESDEINVKKKKIFCFLMIQKRENMLAMYTCMKESDIWKCL